MNGRADNLQSHSIASLLPGTYNNLVLTTIENALHFFFEKIFRNIKQLQWHAVTIVHVIKITPSSRMDTDSGSGLCLQKMNKKITEFMQAGDYG